MRGVRPEWFTLNARQHSIPSTPTHATPTCCAGSVCRSEPFNHMIGRTISHYRVVEKLGGDIKLHIFFSTLRDLAGGHDDSRTGAEGCLGVGGIAVFGWHLPADDVFMENE